MRLETEINAIKKEQIDGLKKLKKIYDAKLEAEDVKYAALEKKIFDTDIKLKK